MKKNLLFTLLASLPFMSEKLLSQCTNTSVAAPDVTLQCNSAVGTTNRTGVAYNPALNLYYSVNAGNSGYSIETFAGTGGNPVSSTTQGADYRGYWWNPVAGIPEGNTYSSGGVYGNSLNGSGYALSTVTQMYSSTMPNMQSCGQADFTNNRIYYYDAGSIYVYNRTTNTLISSTSISGLPVTSGNLNSYTAVYTGVPGSEVGVYNYVNRILYFINGSTGAYVSSCTLPSGAPGPNSFMMGFANNRLFLFESSSYRWLGYPVLNTVNAVVSPTAMCAGATATLTASGATSYSWSTGATTTSITVAPSSTIVYTLQGLGGTGCIPTKQVTLTVNNAAPVLSISSSTPQTCQGHTVTLTASGALSYTWSNGVANGTPFAITTSSNFAVAGQNACGTSTASTSITVSPLAVTASSSPTLVCSGSTSTLSVFAVANTYTWTSAGGNASTAIVSPASTTIYTVTASDGMCTGSTTVAVTTKPNPVITVAASNTSICFGDMVNLTASGNAITYTWNPTGQQGANLSDSPANSTLYSVSGTNSLGCVSSAQEVVLVNPAPVISATVSDPLVCSTYPTTLSASGASTYVWMGGNGSTSPIMVANPVTDETYTVIGTSSLNCSASVTVMVNVYAPTVVVTSNTTICSGGSALVGAGAADSWQWSNGSTNQNITVTPTLTTVYTVTASVNNLNGLSCPATNTVMVTVNAKPNVGATSNYSVICFGNAAVLTATGAATYTWTGGSGATTTPTLLAAPIADQTYTVTGTDANGCVGKAVYLLKVNNCTGIAVNGADNNSLIIYPNPNNGEFTIESPEAMELNVTNNLGQLVQHLSLNAGNNYSVSMSGLASGVYFVMIQGSNQSNAKKIIIQQ